MFFSFEFTENMVATLWLLSLLTVTLITVSECVYAPPPLVKYRRFDNTAFGFQVIFVHVNLNILSSKCLTEVTFGQSYLLFHFCCEI